MKKRLLYHEIIKHIQHKNALVITGMRQVGKTFLMRQIFEELKENKLWFDLENPLEVKLFEDVDYENIYKKIILQSPLGEKSRLFLFIDEIQNFPDITKIIKYFIDHYNVKFVVTGSSCFYLRNLFPESLSGRKFLYQLDPLSFFEYLYFKDALTEEQVITGASLDFTNKLSLEEFKKREAFYEDYVLNGGLPEVVLTQDQETKSMVLKNIFASFFEKDIRMLSDYKDVRELRDLMILLVPRVSSVLQVKSLASDLGIDRTKVYSYLEYLVGAFIIKLVPKFTSNVDRSVAGGKKCYFTDNGILRTLGYVNEGQILENALHSQLSRRGEISFYNPRNISEVDFVLDKKIALEAKLQGDTRDVDKLEYYRAKLSLTKAFVVSKKYSRADGVIFASQV